MALLTRLILACFSMALLAGCGSGPPDVPPSQAGPRPNTDRSRFALLDANGAVAVRLGATLAEVQNAYPIPKNAESLPEADLPEGFGMLAWVQPDGTRQSPAQTLIAYFRDGRLVQISHSIAPVTSADATLWSQRYEKSFGEPVTDRQPARTTRSYGLEQDACRLKLETVRSGADYRFTATLTDSEHVKAMQEALRAMRERKKR